ncbi:MAG: D-alanyl-D-alanine carboxypeptidase/D-alanyl-D-alanine-endopeptidase [Burkholderiales bacterium]|nr:D-alanyl-D-alanine carboxypeptidase/D-alanyl-D-alanine-endopeptidase [Burkholderiales bacterium]
MGVKGWMQACLLAAMATGAMAQTLPATVAAALKAVKVPESAVGVIVMPLDGGAAALENHADDALNPASTMKLVTTFAALENLGPAFQWHTGLYTDGAIEGETLKGNLYMRGGGDPALTYERVWLLLRDLKAAGVRRVAGDLVLDRSYFKLPAARPDAEPFDAQPERAYNVGPDALLMNFKALRFDITSDDHTATVRADPDMYGVSAVSRFKVVAMPCESWRAGWERPEIVSEGGQVRVTLQGRFPRNCRQDRYLGLLDPVEFADRLTRGLWTELGGSIAGKTREGVTPPDAQRFADQASPALAQVIRDVNKLSNNTMARTIFLTLGAEHPQPGRDSAAAAVQLVNEWLGKRGLRFPELTLENGAGLSREERISPRHLAQLLQVAAHSPYGPELLSSLPILGIDGTLVHRLVDTPEAGQGHLKTGTLDDSKAIAGVMRDHAGREWVVVGIANHPRADAAQGAFDRLLEWVWQGAGTASN